MKNQLGKPDKKASKLPFCFLSKFAGKKNSHNIVQPIHHAGQQFRTRLGGKAIRPHGGGLHVRDRSPGKVVSRGTCSACLCLCACPARATCCLLPVKLFFFLFPPSSEVSCAVKKKKAFSFANVDSKFDSCCYIC